MQVINVSNHSFQMLCNHFLLCILTVHLLNCIYLASFPLRRVHTNRDRDIDMLFVHTSLNSV